MNAVTFLQGAYQMELLVQSKMEQIEALRSLAAKVTACMGPEPVVSHTPNHSAMEDTVIKIMEAEEELNRKIDALVDQKLEIGRVIDQVQDPTLRLILEKRHLLFYQWEEIALDLGLTVRWALARHQEAVGVVQGILDGEEIGRI